MIFVFKLKCRYIGPQFPLQNIFRWYHSSSPGCCQSRDTKEMGIMCMMFNEYNCNRINSSNDDRCSCLYMNVLYVRLIKRLRNDRNYSHHLKSAKWYFIIWLNGFDGFLVICMAFLRSYTSWYGRTCIRWN